MLLVDSCFPSSHILVDDFKHREEPSNENGFLLPNTISSISLFFLSHNIVWDKKWYTQCYRYDHIL